MDEQDEVVDAAVEAESMVLDEDKLNEVTGGRDTGFFSAPS